MMQQFNFSTQESSEALALLVSIAETATLFDLSNQDTTRPVKVEVTPATASSQENADSNGHVIVSNLVTNALLVSVSTSRTSTPAFTYSGTYDQIEFTIDTDAVAVLINTVEVIGDFEALLSTPITTTCNGLWQ